MRKVALALGLVLLASCSINDRVEPLAVSKITKICLKTNEAVHMSGFRPEVIYQFERHGVTTTTYSGARPKTAGTTATMSPAGPGIWRCT